MSCADCYTQPCYNKALTRPPWFVCFLCWTFCVGEARTGQANYKRI